MITHRIRFAVALLALQALAAAFFVADSLFDAGEQSTSGALAALSWLEVGLAVALLGGIVVGAVLVRRLMIEARRREQALALARGALGEVVAARFGEWRLSPAEADVGLFALKGLGISDIARLRGSAEGTVRAQLSQVYAKAGVTSQAMLMSLFLEDLISDDGVPESG